MATSPLFGWQEPDDTSLVKDGAAAIRTLGNAIDTSMGDLLGGTSGQILSKASNANMDFTWITNDVGDITAVNVTSPITGGGTSGAVTIAIQDATTAQKGAVQLENSTSSTSTTTAAVPAAVKTSYDLAAAAVPKSTVTTNGDLIIGTGSATVSRLGIGSTGNVLTVSGGVPVWSAPAGGGKVLQVVSATYSTDTTSTSTSYVDTGLSLSITPSSSSSKILAIVTVPFVVSRYPSTYCFASFNLMRGSTQVWDDKTNWGMEQQNSGTCVLYATHSMNYLDSPATTSATTYKVQMKVDATSSTMTAQRNNGVSVITLMEIGA